MVGWIKLFRGSAVSGYWADETDGQGIRRAGTALAQRVDDPRSLVRVSGQLISVSLPGLPDREQTGCSAQSSIAVRRHVAGLSLGGLDSRTPTGVLSDLQPVDISQPSVRVADEAASALNSSPLSSDLRYRTGA